MWKLTFKQIFARKVRFLLTTFAVIIGVAFVVSTFALADSLRTTFDELAGDIQSSTDLTVRAAGSTSEDFSISPIPESTLDDVLAIDGVAAGAIGVGAGGVNVIDGDGDAIVPNGPPSFGLNWVVEPGLQQYFLTDGSEAPQGPDEFVVNTTTAEDNDLEIGARYQVSGPIEQREFTLVGIANFADPDEDKLIGAVSAIFATETAQSFLGLEGQALNVSIDVDDGANVEQVRTDLQAALGPEFEVATQQELTDETADSFGAVVSIFNNVLLAFALITLFVAAFLVNNVFQIIVSQRVRELALLRAVGATGGQVTRSILGEALAVGVFSTAAGLGLGVLFAIGLRAALDAVGFGLPSGPVELRLRTVVFAAVVGIGITVVSALAPAIRARKVPPVAAMREGFQLPAGSLRRRLIRGGLVAAIGFVLLMLGLFGDLETVPLLAAVAVGGVLVFLGVNGLAPAFAAPVAHALGRPIRAVFKLPGRLAQENAARTPRRTASTAGALTIGLALVAMAAVIGDSIKSTFIETLDNAVESDFFLQPEGGGFGPGASFTGQVADELKTVDGVASVARYRFTLGGIVAGSEGHDTFATDFSELSLHIDPQVVDGSLDDLASTDLLLHEDPASDLGLAVGDLLPVLFNDEELETLRVAAVYEDSSVLGNWVISMDTWDAHFTERSDAFVSVLVDEGTDPDQVRPALEAVTEEFPTVKLEDLTELKESSEQQLDSFLAVIFVFLALALLIAVMGIAITLSLSVFERTRELGLLRAVGMTKIQMRRMVRWEAVIVALFGAIIGVGLGVLFGVAASQAIPETVIKSVTIPVFQLFMFFVIAAIAGVGAAVIPAYRASHMQVLDAIAEE
jgi:putative ABC transport system permease protein